MLTPAGERELAAERGEWERSSGTYGWKVGLPRTGSARRRHTGGKSELSGVAGRRLPLAPNGQEFLPTCVRVPSENDADARFAGSTGRRRAPRCTLACVLLRLLVTHRRWGYRCRRCARRSHSHASVGITRSARSLLISHVPRLVERVTKRRVRTQIGRAYRVTTLRCSTRLPHCHSIPELPPVFSHLSQTGTLADSSSVVTDPDPQSS
jgi:hypothetical protein